MDLFKARINIETVRYEMTQQLYHPPPTIIDRNSHRDPFATFFELSAAHRKTIIKAI